jgi:hypothetical protein
MKFLKVDVGLTDMRRAAFNIFMYHWVNLEILNRLDCSVLLYAEFQVDEPPTDFSVLLYAKFQIDEPSTDSSVLLYAKFQIDEPPTDFSVLLYATFPMGDSFHILSYRWWNHRANRGMRTRNPWEHIWNTAFYSLTQTLYGQTDVVIDISAYCVDRMTVTYFY